MTELLSSVIAEVFTLWRAKWPRQASRENEAALAELYAEDVRGRPLTAIRAAARTAVKSSKYMPSPEEFKGLVWKAVEAERAAMPVPPGSPAKAPEHGVLPDAQFRTAESLGKVEAGIEAKIGRRLDTRERVQALTAVTSALWTVYRAMPIAERQSHPCLRAHGIDLTVPWVRETVRAATLGVIEQLKAGSPIDTGATGPLSGTIVDATTGRAA